MTTHDSTPQGSVPPEDIGSALEHIHRLATGVEPAARDLNRALTDLVGTCPVGDDGTWTRIVVDPEGRHFVQLPTLPVDVALRLSTAIAAVAEGLEPPAPSTAGLDYRLPFALTDTGETATSGFARAAL